MNEENINEEAENYSLAQQQEELNELLNDSLAELGEYIEPISEEEEEELLAPKEIQFDEIKEAEDNVVPFGKPPPKTVIEFINSACEVSNNNPIPASISYLSLLGQICKDFIFIPKGRNTLDTRVHFCWIQTSGTGKSTLWNFIEPVSDKLFKTINNAESHPARIGLNLLNPVEDKYEGIPRKFDTFSLTDYTDAVLVGTWTEEKEMQPSDENDPFSPEIPTGKMIQDRVAGRLEGSGLAHWDEFEYSGVFKQSLHQEKAIPYLNTLMNSTAGKAWIIKKATASMKEKDMFCFCERSVLAMTYPPENLIKVIATKGVLQRMLIFVKNVSKREQHEMRLKQLAVAGIAINNDDPVDYFANQLHELYKLTKEKFNGNPLETVTYSPEFKTTLQLSYIKMQDDLLGTPIQVDKVADNFTTRMMDMLIKMSVLCCIAESPERNKNAQFIVTAQNVEQAERIVRQCYKSLVGWLKQSLRTPSRALTEKGHVELFKETFKKMRKDENGAVHKTKFLTKIQKDGKISRAQTYRIYEALKNKFIEEQTGQSKYLKLKGDEE
jgi:hypothetical protein